MPQVLRYLFPLADENVISSKPYVSFGNCLPCWFLMILSQAYGVSHHRCADEYSARNLKDPSANLQRSLTLQLPLPQTSHLASLNFNLCLCNSSGLLDFCLNSSFLHCYLKITSSQSVRAITELT